MRVGPIALDHLRGTHPTLDEGLSVVEVDVREVIWKPVDPQRALSASYLRKHEHLVPPRSDVLEDTRWNPTAVVGEGVG